MMKREQTLIKMINTKMFADFALFLLKSAIFTYTCHVVLFKNKHTCWLTSAGFVCGLGRLSLCTSCIFHLRNPLESHITSICLTWFVWKYPEIKVWIKGNSWPFRFFPLSLYENDWNPFTLLVRLNLYKSMSFILEDCQD